MTVNELLKLIPPQLFRDLAVETKVDAQVKKLSGEVMFKLILFSMLSSEKLSLRVMETFLQSAKFKSFSHFDILDSRYNSIRDRICTINATYFEKLFASIFAIYNKELKEEKALSKTDSTYVSLATKLFANGMKNGSKEFRFRTGAGLPHWPTLAQVSQTPALAPHWRRSLKYWRRTPVLCLTVTDQSHIQSCLKNIVEQEV